MSDERRWDDGDPGDGDGDGEDERELDRLLRAAGPRPEAAAGELEAIKTAFRAEWRQRVAEPRAHRRRLRLTAALALAASLLAAVGLAWLSRRTLAPAPAPPLVVARVLAAEPGSELVAGEELAAGSTLSTGETGGRLALRLAGGAELRIDRGSRVRLISASELELARGAVYLDSGSGPGDLSVLTPFGRVSDVGTRFEVRLIEEAAAVRVRVREGEVRVSRQDATARALAGEELEIDRDGGLERSSIAQHGEAWEWVLASAPPFELEGKTLAEVLAWIGRETGWQIRFADADLAGRAAMIVVHGSFTAVRPDRVHELLLPGAGLAWGLDAGVLSIRTAS